MPKHFLLFHTTGQYSKKSSKINSLVPFAYRKGTKPTKLVLKWLVLRTNFLKMNLLIIILHRHFANVTLAQRN